MIVRANLKTLLICHHDSLLNRYGISLWLMSFSNLSGIIVIKEKKSKKIKRLKRELARNGLIRFFDVVAFKIFYYLRFQKLDSNWISNKLSYLKNLYNYDLSNIPRITVSSPNSKLAKEFINNSQPDIIIARCKVLLKNDIFSQARTGTFIMHPGICPEYRNSHGCFWSIVNQDYDKVGMTLLKINEGIDSGPIYGFYYVKDFNLLKESHITIQYRAVFDNLESIQNKLLAVYEGKATSIQPNNRNSKLWGQPWLSSYFKWKYNGKK